MKRVVDLSGFLQNFFQLLFLVLGERCLQNFTLEIFEFLQYVVRDGFAHQHEKGRGARLESLTEFLLFKAAIC